MTIWDERYKSGEGLRWWPNEELVRFIGRQYPSHAIAYDGNVLDLGCGTGCNLWPLWEKGLRCWGIDSSAEAIRTATLFLSDRTDEDKLPTLQRMELPGPLAFGDGMFDLVVDCQTIQHLSGKDHFKAYAEVLRVLKPGGRFWSMHFATGDSGVVYAGCYPELKWCSVEEQCYRLRDSGFTVDDWSVVSRTYNNCRHVMRWAVIEAVKP